MLYASEIGNALNDPSFLKYLTFVVQGKRLTKIGGSFVIQSNTPMANRNGTTKTNPRYQNGHRRRKYRQYFKALGVPCAICGRPIHYDEPSDAQHPWSFVIDEIIPVSKYWLGGYSSKAECAQDFNNLQAAHYCCNARKGNKINIKLVSTPVRSKIDGDW